jgi:hypothetical protein
MLKTATQSVINRDKKLYKIDTACFKLNRKKNDFEYLIIFDRTTIILLSKIKISDI